MTADEDEELAALTGPWVSDFNPERGWTTQCERCDAPLVVEAGLYPSLHLAERHQGALCDYCAETMDPAHFQTLCEARDRHLQERPFDER